MDPRLGELFKSKTVDQLVVNNAFALLGYPDDDGIKLNGGRIGAAEGPNKVREYLFKMTPPGIETYQPFSDLGNLDRTAPLEQRHEIAKEMLSQLYKKQQRVITLGGGHDYGYPDGAAFIEHFSSSPQKPVLLNFDAHLDVRPTTNGFNSGTPFYRLLSEYKNAFTLFEIGIQPQCNSPYHRQWAQENGAIVVDLAEIEKNGGLNCLWNHDVLKNINSEVPILISFDIDGITSSEGGGCSQAWATGLKAQDYLHFFSQLKQKANVRGLGIYEVAPNLDTDNRTSKLAGLIAYHFLFQDNL